LENKILDGKKLADELNSILKNKIKQTKKESGITPKLATILVGEDPASKIYINIKQKTCKKIGIDTKNVNLNKNTKKEEVIREIKALNEDKDVHGILLQLPLPPPLENDVLDIIKNIDPQKDVDGLHPINLGKLYYKNEELAPCTPKGIIKLLNHYKIPIEGKDITIINHSTLLGRPLAQMFLNRKATVSICHINTKNLEKYTLQADILIVGIGKANFIKKQQIKKNSIIIDVGINRMGDELYGDVDFNDVVGKVGMVTPVPGGVGPMTVAMLLKNTFLLYEKSVNK
jgi:methylenetetrahydrofolate dehydrogenase (NADP+)/methenyltetrahydrofolate cyclohydrolase